MYAQLAHFMKAELEHEEVNVVCCMIKEWTELLVSQGAFELAMNRLKVSPHQVDTAVKRQSS